MTAVREGSVSARAGLLPGDRLVRLRATVTAQQRRRLDLSGLDEDTVVITPPDARADAAGPATSVVDCGPESMAQVFRALPVTATVRLRITRAGLGPGGQDGGWATVCALLPSPA